MMRSFGQLTQDFLTITGNTGAGNKATGQSLINETDKIVQALRPWQFLEATQNVTTTANGSAYDLKVKTAKVLSVRDSSNKWPPIKPSPDPDHWERLQSFDISSSDVPEWYRIIGGQLQIWPAYGTASNTLVVRYKKTRRDMTGDDYTTGTITSIANGAKAVVGNATTWNKANHVIADSSWIQFSGATGDDLWYQIATVGSTTALTLSKNYEGTSIAAATDTYRIGQMSLLPGEYHQLLLLRPLAMYFQQHENAALARMYWRQYDGGYEIGERDTPGGLLGQLCDSHQDFDDSPYIQPEALRDERNVNDPPSNLTGF